MVLILMFIKWQPQEFCSAHQSSLFFFVSKLFFIFLFLHYFPSWRHSVCCTCWCLTDSRVVEQKWSNFLDIENTAIKERGKCTERQMEEANHCYKIEMTPLTFMLICCSCAHLPVRPEMLPSPVFFSSFFFMLKVKRLELSNKAWCHIKNRSRLQWVISGAFHKLTTFSSEARRTADF